MKILVPVFFHIFFVFIISKSFAQKDLGAKYYNSGIEYLNKGEYILADSLFTLSLDQYPAVDAYINRAVVRKKLGDTLGYCSDLYRGTANGDKSAQSAFLNNCTDNDTVYLDKNGNETEKYLSILMKIIAKHKYDPVTDIVWVDLAGHKTWRYEADSDSLLHKDSVLTRKAEVMPTFPGGENALVKYLSDNLKYPRKSRENGIKGKVFVTFIVDREGKIRDVKILKGLDDACNNEVFRLISMMPQWFPAMVKGEFVHVQCNLPITFSLGE